MNKIITKFLYISFLLGFFCSPFTAKAQIGGENVYEFLDLSTSARVTALGGLHIATRDDDISLAAQNPSLYNSEMNTQLSLNTVAFVAGINHGYLGFAKDIDSLATFGVGIQYISYGDLIGADETGLVTGSFSAAEYAFNVGGAKQFGKFSYGMNLKVIFSNLESYSSTGLALDMGLSYYDEESMFNAALVVKNMGTQLSNYLDTDEDLPFDIQLGISQRLKHLPFRFGITAHHLQKWDIRYDDPNLQTSSIFDDGSDSNKSYFADNLFRHLIFSGELFLGKSLVVRAAYNHQRKQELGVDIKGGGVGFSYGAGIHIKRFHVSYGRANYHLAGGSHHFSISTKLKKG
ncbi:MAG: type IX secretion system protein PorQ [Chitinophagales bacterium]